MSGGLIDWPKILIIKIIEINKLIFDDEIKWLMAIKSLNKFKDNIANSGINIFE